MSKVIQVVVIGATGSGKSHALSVIDAALREAYGPHAQIVSRDLSLERSLGGPTTEPSVDTIFHLKERQPGAEPMVSTIKIDVDTSAIDTATGKLEALQGCALSSVGAALGSFSLDPLESAIQSTASMLRDERESMVDQQGTPTPLSLRLASHLGDLLAEQLARVKAQ
ncbi:hypothetical protein PSCICL_45850 [Pseudomonas cichorii]|nr:hypothetical protein PSCICL_45850 [Pseudomonas cichorii]